MRTGAPRKKRWAPSKPGSSVRLEDRAHDSEQQFAHWGVQSPGVCGCVSKESEVTAMHGIFPQSIDAIPRFTEIKGIILILNKREFYIKHNTNVCMNYF